MDSPWPAGGRKLPPENLRTNDGEHLSSCLLPMCASSLKNTDSDLLLFRSWSNIPHTKSTMSSTLKGSALTSRSTLLRNHLQNVLVPIRQKLLPSFRSPSCHHARFPFWECDNLFMNPRGDSTHPTPHCKPLIWAWTPLGTDPCQRVSQMCPIHLGILGCKVCPSAIVS